MLVGAAGLVLFGDKGAAFGALWLGDWWTGVVYDALVEWAALVDVFLGVVNGRAKLVASLTQWRFWTSWWAVDWYANHSSAALSLVAVTGV